MALVLSACGSSLKEAEKPASEAQLVEKPSDESPQCVEVGIGLDLNALPQPASVGEIDLYTGGQADEFRGLFGNGVRVEIFVRAGVASFTARLHSKSEDDLLGICATTSEKFIATVPGHPMINEPGGSIVTPCGPCTE